MTEEFGPDVEGYGDPGLGGDIHDPDDSVDEAPVCALLCPWEAKSQLTPLPFQGGHQAQIEKKLPNSKRAESTLG